MVKGETWTKMATNHQKGISFAQGFTLPKIKAFER